MLDGGSGVTVTYGDPAILHLSLLRGAAFTSSLAKEAAAMQLAQAKLTTRPPIVEEAYSPFLKK